MRPDTFPCFRMIVFFSCPPSARGRVPFREVVTWAPISALPVCSDNPLCLYGLHLNTHSRPFPLFALSAGIPPPRFPPPPPVELVARLTSALRSFSTASPPHSPTQQHARNLPIADIRYAIPCVTKPSWAEFLRAPVAGSAVCPGRPLVHDSRPLAD